MKKHPVTFFCGYQGMGHSPAQRFCNRKCSGYFVSRRPTVAKKKVLEFPTPGTSMHRARIPACDPIWLEKGNRHLTKSGYVDLYFWSPEMKKQISRREHIVIWCTVNCQELPPGWAVHHRDEDRSNNNPENLLAMPVWIHTELHRELESLAKEYTGLDYLLRRHALTKEYEDRVREMCEWEALKK